MTLIHNLGFPRIGANRELKHALEAYWAGSLSKDELIATGALLREKHWQVQANAGVQLLPVGDFAWYDHILEWSALLGAVPARFEQPDDQSVALDTVFRMARGRAPAGKPAAACEMTKWFDTDYHYIVPELSPDQTYRIAREELFEEGEQAQALGHKVKPVIPGPLTWLWLGKGDAFSEGADDEAKLALLDALLPVYVEVLKRFASQGVEWVQIDEPILVLDLPEAWQKAYAAIYQTLSQAGLKLLLTTYFGGLGDNLAVLDGLAIDGIHIDCVRAPQQIDAVAQKLNANQVLSLGVVDGRNVWRTDLDAARTAVQGFAEELGDRLWLAPSCSLLHVPVDLRLETELDAELQSWLSFAIQKLDELHWLACWLNNRLDETVRENLHAQRKALQGRRDSARITNPAVRERVAQSVSISRDRTPFAQRIELQQKALGLPRYPTTTIGSFPQTQEIRRLRRQWRHGEITDAGEQKEMQEQIEEIIRFQEKVGLDECVHGEDELNDMVEYFGELLAGFAFTQYGWVQSYGSRCVKPPLIFGDVLRPAAMTVGWSSYAQSLTDKPVKGMLTGPVTILQWSFVRDDQPREETCRQLALALRDEVLDLEAAGIHVIQIDEPAVREGLPLRKGEWQAYLDWAVDCFRLTTSGVADTTQIHTHMCYSEVNDIIDSIAALDADVITIATSRSHMELLEAFENFHYPNDIGPGVYDIHSPNIPDVDWMVSLMRKAAKRLPAERLWVNPDCGLKTRDWPETEAALIAMVEAAKQLRQAA